MIKIEITLPMPENVLVETAKYLMALSGNTLQEAPAACPPEQWQAREPLPPLWHAPDLSPDEPASVPVEPLPPATAPAHAPVTPPPAPPATAHVPPPPAPAVPVTTASASVPASAPALDTRKMPWDSRIHSRSKSVNVDGTWRYMRGVSQDKINIIEDELRRAMSGNEIGTPVTVPPIPTEPAPDFGTLMEKITSVVTAGKLSHVDINAIFNARDLASIPVAAVRPDLIPALMADIDAAIASGGSHG